MYPFTHIHLKSIQTDIDRSHYVSATWPKKSGQIKTQFLLIYSAFSHLKVSNYLI